MVVESLPGVYWIKLRWVNVYLWKRDDGYTLIDAGLPWQAGDILKAIEELQASPSEVKRILITHGDIDHVGALATLKAETGAEVVAHGADKPIIELLHRRPLRKNVVGALYSPIYNAVTSLLLKPAVVDRIVLDKEILPEEGLKVIYTPGHTPGHVCYYHPERKILFSGDLFMHVRGKIRGPYSLFTPDPAGVQESQRKVASLKIDAVFFGHGEPVLESASSEIGKFAPSPLVRGRKGSGTTKTK
jgi:glyoxylase-like metal-dependent hydrolase (beta-lactamase superfamily II)